MHPADKHVALIRIVLMDQKITAFLLKLCVEPLPSSAFHLAHDFAIGKFRLQSRHHQSQLAGHHSKKIDHAHLVRWRVHQPQRR